jgi:acetyl-CoA carboxylase beta subunit
MSQRFSLLRGHERALALCDQGRFEAAWAKEQSPLLLGKGWIEGREVLFVFLDGHVRGGTIGVEEAAAVTGFLEKSLASFLLYFLQTLG